MLLLIQRSKAEILTVQNEVCNIRDQIQKTIDSTIVNKQIEIMDKQLKEYSESIHVLKSRKFNHDLQDYEFD